MGSLSLVEPFLIERKYSIGNFWMRKHTVACKRVEQINRIWYAFLKRAIFLASSSCLLHVSSFSCSTRTRLMKITFELCIALKNSARPRSFTQIRESHSWERSWCTLRVLELMIATELQTKLKKPFKFHAKKKKILHTDFVFEGSGNNG